MITDYKPNERIKQKPNGNQRGKLEYAFIEHHRKKYKEWWHYIKVKDDEHDVWV